jgi:hypothetical protein
LTTIKAIQYDFACVDLVSEALLIIGPVKTLNILLFLDASLVFSDSLAELFLFFLRLLA